MKKLLAILGLVTLTLPLLAGAQIFSQSQLIQQPYGGSASYGFVYSSSTGSGGKLGASTSPYLLTFTFGNATGTNATTTSFFSTNASTTNLWVATGLGCLQVNSAGKVTSTGSNCNSGTVTSVTLATPNSTLTVGGTNPITTSGTINVDLNLASQNIWTGASTTFVGGVTIGTSTTTSATTTNFFATTASTSKLFVSTGAGCLQVTNGQVLSTGSNCGSGSGAVNSVTDDGNQTLTISPNTGAVLAAINLTHGNIWTPASTTFVNGVTIGRATTTSATTTALAISGIASGNCLQTTTGGAIIGSGSTCGTGSGGGAYPFQGSNNSTSTLTGFTGGIYATASSTIGGGTTTSGLTVNGTATTTDEIVTSLNGSVGGRFVAANTQGKLVDLASTLLILPLTNGGTGASDSIGAMDNLSPLGTKGDLMTHTGIHNVALAVGSNETFLQASSTQTDGLAYSKISLARSVLDTLPVSNGGTGITSFGTGIATFLGTPSSANLASAITDETGTAGSLVFSVSPVLTGLLGIGTSTPYFQLTDASVTPIFDLDATSAGTNQKHFIMGNYSGLFAIGTSSDTNLNSTSTDLTLQPNAILSFGIGTSSPYAAFSLVSSSTPVLVIATSTQAASQHPIYEIDPNGHHIFGGPTPTCGTGCSSVVGNDNGGAITTTSAATSVTLTFANAWSATPVCTISDNSTAITGDISAISTTAFTASFSVGLTGTVYYQCAQFGS